MKYIRQTSLLLLIVLVSSCLGKLEDEAFGPITDTQVWKDKNLADAFLADIYFRTDFVNLTRDRGYNQGMIASMGAEARTLSAVHAPYVASTTPFTSEGPASPDVDYWKYDNIRNANFFIKQMETISNFEEDFIAQRVAEARFLRAYMYFEMLKRYGGLPILTEDASIDSSGEELALPRNSEQELYDFIIGEMDDIALILPEHMDEKSRPSKWAALALKSRVALYAASIAKYGSEQLNGLLGVPNSEMQSYAKASFEASQLILLSSGHELYTRYGNKSNNFQQLFLDESENNKEVIFAERFDLRLGAGHSLSHRAMPHGFSKSWGSNFHFFYDFVELFEFQDGSPGTSIGRDDLTQKEWEMKDLFHNRDPRFRASIFYPESPWQGSEVLFHSSTLVDGQPKTTGTVDGSWPARAPARNTIRTGFQLKKRIDETARHPLANEDDTDYYVFRLGEIYLNLAEAAFYLDDTKEALEAINVLRARAGMPEKTAVTEAIIRNERQVELAFEDHRYWDLRRWRIAVTTLNGVRLKGLRYDYNWDTKKYKIRFRNAEGVERAFEERNYYFPLGLDRLAKNPELVENPGY